MIIKKYEKTFGKLMIDCTPRWCKHSTIRNHRLIHESCSCSFSLNVQGSGIKIGNLVAWILLILLIFPSNYTVAMRSGLSSEMTTLTSTTYTYTGGTQTIIIPSGFNSMIVTLYGAAGAAYNTTLGGAGAVISASIPVLPGEEYQLVIGGTCDGIIAGYNGGGSASSSTSYSRAGGGATDIRKSPYSLYDRILVAGGGGGASGNSSSSGGAGGYPDGAQAPGNWGAPGGTQTQGGYCGAYSSGTCQPAGQGSFGLGGNAGTNTAGLSYGSGGGGGYYGGGGAAGGSGGGGSSYSLYTITSTTGSNVGNGYATIEYLLVNPTVLPTISPTQLPATNTTTVPAANLILKPTPSPTIIPTTSPIAAPTVDPTAATMSVPTSLFLTEYSLNNTDINLNSEVHHSSKFSALASTTYSYSGAPQTITIGADITSMVVTLYGGSGSTVAGGGAGGKGAVISTSITVVAGQQYTLYIGGQGSGPTGGYNGGGAGFTGVSYSGGGGGGATDIRNAAGTKLLVAGGGGGGGEWCGSSGGNGGYSSGSSGVTGNTCNNPATYFAGGSGGTSSAGGAFGDCSSCGHTCSAANNGGSGTGGPGCISGTYAGGGGGGGYFGGGGSYLSGGGGGSSYSYNTPTSPGVNTGNGYAVINYISAPTTTPTAAPSAPTCAPTTTPTRVPTALPTSQPSSSPTRQPSAQPSCQPSTQPTSQPSSSPSRQPTAQPSAEPTGRPSSDPTGQPSGVPSAQPICSPTSRPSSQPTSQPSTAPFSQPSTAPSSQPSTAPSSQPSTAPSSQPSTAPSSQTSTAPSSQPSTAPSSQPSLQPSALPSSQPSAIPSCHPSSLPTRQPSAQPSVLPSGQPSAQPSAAPTAQSVGLSINSISSTRTGVEVRVQGLWSGGLGAYVFCAALLGTQTQLTTLTEIYRYNQMVFMSGNDRFVSMNTTALLPSTAYTVYCTAKSVQGLEMSLQEAQQTAQYVATKCCKEVVVTVLQPSVVSGAAVSKAVAIKLSSSPSLAAPSLQLSVSYTAQTGSIGSVSVLPSAFTFGASNALQSEYSAAVLASAGGAGTFTLTAQLTGSAAADYTIVYGSSRTVTVRALGTVPPIPRVQKSQFSNSGSSITVSFGSPTDQGGQFGNFACTKLLSFAGANVATCQWRDAAVLEVYPVYSTVADIVLVGSNITLLGNALRAKCVVVVGSPCNSWASIQPTVVTVQPPVAVLKPALVMSVPTSIGGCSSMVVDLSNSVGGAGRPWFSVRFTVETQGSGVSAAALQLERFLTYNYTLNPPTPVPYTSFEKDRTYLIQATLCNFLGACATATREVSVAAMGTVVPVVSILGQSVRSVYRPEPFSISASAYTQSCGGPPSTAALVYAWTTKTRLNGETVFSDVAIRSTSQSPTIYKLPAFSLAVRAEYQITLSVLSTVSGVRSTASVLVSVPTSALTAIISGGSPRYALVGDTVVLDASKSYDADYPSTSAQNAGLFFLWDCVQTAPVFAVSCVLTLPQALNTSKLSVSVTHLTLNTTSQLSVTVYDATRSSVVHTSVVVVGAPRPKLAITNSVSSMANINTGTQFALLGSVTLLKPCTSVWSVDNPSVLLSYTASTPVRQSLVPVGRAPVAFNLVLKRDSLPQRSQLTFSLTCDDTIATAVVTTNGAPLPGDFTVTPASGEELSTQYVYAALQWTDPDLPLIYQFGFESAVSLSNLVIVVKSELTYTQFTLPAGSELSGYQVNASLLVFDSYGAFTTMKRSVVVNPSPREQQLDALKQFMLSGSDSADGLKQTISVASAVLNSVNCSMVTNCTLLNRHPCQRTSGECGACLPGYMGDAGDRSTQCMPRTTADVPKQCTTATQCALWERCDADSGACVVLFKSCSRNCSDHGSCVYLDSITGGEIQQCSLRNAGCEAACSCTDGYSGQFCEFTPSDLRTKQDLRSSLVNSLRNLSKADDINAESVSGWSDSLYSVSIKPYELSLEDKYTLSDLTNVTLANALKLKVETPELIAGVLQATDTITTLQYNYDPSAEHNASYTFPNNTVAAILHTLGGYGDLVVSNMVLGENHTEVMYNNFGMSTHKVSVTSGASNITLTTSQFATSRDGQVSTVTLTPGNTSVVAGVKLISVPPRLFTSNTTAFVSAPITLRLQQTDASEVLMSDAVSFISFTFQHIEPQLQYLDGSGGNFTSHCVEGQNASHVSTYICPGSGNVLQHNCSQGAGTYISHCPKPTPVCSRLDTTTTAITRPTACRVVTYTPTSTQCECSLRIPTVHGRLLSTEEDVTQLLDDSGATNMMVSTTYIASSFVDTFNSAEGLNNGSVEDVYVVAFSLGGLWTIGLLVLVSHWVREWTSGCEDSSSVKPDEQTDALKSVLEYVHQTVPAVFNDNDQWTHRLWQELVDHHTLFAIFQGNDMWERLKVVFTTLTEQTFMLFLVAVFFDVSVPSNDNSCEAHQTTADCLRRVSPFDYTQTYCNWTLETQECRYNSQEISFEAIFYLSILTTVITSIATLPIEYMFSTLNAPTATSLKGSKVAAIVDTVVNGARKLSKIAGVTSTTTNKDSVRRKSILSSIISEPDSVIANREISAELTEVASRARLSTAAIQSRATLQLTRLEEADRKLRDVSTRRSSLSVSSKSPHRDSIRTTEHAAMHSNSKRNDLTLLVDIIQQRLLMNDAAKETKKYDEQWGVRVCTEQFTIAQYTIDPVAENAITQAVQEAQNETKQLLESISNYSVHHAGLEILHLFIVDLLGRTTLAAKIFQEKFGEEFGHSRVVVMGQKIVAIVMIVLLNAFFMYYILLKGFQKGLTWQWQFLFCSLAQFVVDMFIFETAECVWLNFTVPRFVCTEVTIAAKKLIQVTEKLTSSSDDIEQQLPPVEKTSYFLNAPKHLFVSIRVAKALPQLLESTIVSSYTHHLPGEICRTWPHCAEQQEQGPQPCTGWVVFPRSLLRGVLLAVQVVISGSYTYQRIFLRFVLPVLFSGVCTIVYTVVKNETEFIVLGIVLGIAVAYTLWSLCSRYCASDRDKQAVAPEPSTEINDGIPTFLLLEEEEQDSDSDMGESKSDQDDALSELNSALIKSNKGIDDAVESKLQKSNCAVLDCDTGEGDQGAAAVVSEPHCAVLDHDAGEGDQGAAAVVSEPHSAVIDHDAGEGDQGAAAIVVSEPHCAVLDYDTGEGDQGAAAVVSEPHCAVLDCDTGEGDQGSAAAVMKDSILNSTNLHAGRIYDKESDEVSQLRPVQSVSGTRNHHSNKWSLDFN